MNTKTNIKYQKQYIVDYCKNNNLLPYIKKDKLIILYISFPNRQISYKYIRMIENNLSFIADKYQIINKKEQSSINKNIISTKPLSYQEYLDHYHIQEKDLYKNEAIKSLIIQNHKRVLYEYHSKFYQVLYLCLYNNYCDLEFIYNFLCEFLEEDPISYQKPDYISNPEIVNIISKEKCNEKERNLPITDKIKYIKTFFKLLETESIACYNLEDISKNHLKLLGLDLDDIVQNEALLEYAKLNTTLLKTPTIKNFTITPHNTKTRKKIHI